MIDYYAHVAVGRVLRAAAPFTAGATAVELAWIQQLVDDAASEEGAELLGLFVDHVLANASADGTEDDLLETAGALWRRGTDLHGAVGEVRAAVEAALVAPEAPGSVAAFDGATRRLTGLLKDARGIESQAQRLREDLRPLRHLPPHPRQADRPLDAWGYGDAFLARRGDAFVRTLFDRAGGDRVARALALGALASYTGNVAGSAFLAHGVGGPRRSHRFRDRLARNAVGSWCAGRYAVPTAGALADAVRPYVPDGVTAAPSPVARLLADALAETHDPQRMPPLPDLDLGLRRTLRRLELYDAVRRPGPPAPLTREIGVRVHASPGGGVFVGAEPFAYPYAGAGAGAGGVTVPGGTATPADMVAVAVAGAAGCGWLGVLTAAVAAGVAGVAGLVRDGDRARGVADLWTDLVGEDPSGEGPIGRISTAGRLRGLADSPAGPELAHRLFQLQCELWQVADEAFAFLALVGLVPPDDALLHSGLYRQFTVLPPREDGYPLREDREAATRFGLEPGTAVERRGEDASPFSAGDDPSAFVEGAAVRSALGLLLQVVRGDHRSDNLDADADRGYRHRCWRTGAGGSVADDPVPVEQLAYGET